MKQQTVFIGLGTNLGDRAENLHTALSELKRYMHIEQCSSIYETEPVGYKLQGWFLNMVVRAGTDLSPHELLHRLQATELHMGRRPAVAKGPRIIDLDILLFADLVLTDDTLIIPHPELQNRGFVLVPLNEIAPGVLHPQLKKDMHTLLRNLRTDKQVYPWISRKAAQ